jgi:cytochrome c5
LADCLASPGCTERNQKDWLMKNRLILSIALIPFATSVPVQLRASAAQTAGTASQPSSAPASPAAPSGLAILNRSCTSCHDASQVTQARPAADWQPIIERMRDNGASISDSDAKLLLEYLLKNYSSGH